MCLSLLATGSGHVLWQPQGDYVYSAKMPPNRTPQPSDELYIDNVTSPVSPKPAAPNPTLSIPAGPKKQTTPKPVPGETMTLELRDLHRANAVLYNLGVVYFLGSFFMHKFKNNAWCNNMLNRLHVLYIHVSTSCQEEFLLSIDIYIYYIYFLENAR